MKIPYHGNFQKKLDNLLENINPKYAVITSSEDEPEEDKMIQLLDEMGIKYYLTREGAVQIYSDKKNITINQWADNVRRKYVKAGNTRRRYVKIVIYNLYFIYPTENFWYDCYCTKKVGQKLPHLD